MLAERGVDFYRNGSNHDVYIHKKSGKKIPIPRHNEIEDKLVKDILKEIPNN
jgi:predicted RNA binding protein YcfA (HicA-like mRNA interferase family)